MRRIILACALAGISGVLAFGQQAVPPEEGIYVLNPAKSTFRGPAAKTQTLNVGKETITVIGFDANGKPFSTTFPDITDGKSHQVPGVAAFDASTSTRLILTPFQRFALKTDK